MICDSCGSEDPEVKVGQDEGVTILCQACADGGPTANDLAIQFDGNWSLCVHHECEDRIEPSDTSCEVHGLPTWLSWLGII